MSHIQLDLINTRAPENISKQDTKETMKGILKDLNKLQNLLYAEDKHSILVILQGMDASGKDGVIRKVFTSMNPQGVNVSGFKAPTREELSHYFLWRIHSRVPARGMISIFNRSHYEDVLVTRVHGWCDDALACSRMEAINNFEALLAEHNNTHILKFYLHISAAEQKERLDERMNKPSKMWKYNAKDYEEAALFTTYQKMYEDCFKHCNHIPWIIVPSDQNWYKEFMIASALRDTLQKLKMEYPGLKK